MLIQESTEAWRIASKSNGRNVVKYDGTGDVCVIFCVQIWVLLYTFLLFSLFIATLDIAVHNHRRAAMPDGLVV
jgi:hypothetical protein